jgi:hypothetical protein
MKYFIIFLSYIASPKFCLHCTHFIPHDLGNKFGTCKFFPVKNTDTSFLVTGEKEEVKYNYCSVARNYDYMCGEYAKHYFPKYIDIEPIGDNRGGGDDDLSGLIQSIF